MPITTTLAVGDTVTYEDEPAPHVHDHRGSRNRPYSLFDPEADEATYSDLRQYGWNLNPQANCTDCGRPAPNLTACEGGRLCPVCTTAYLTGKAQDFNANYYGERYRYATGADLPLTPRGRLR